MGRFKGLASILLTILIAGASAGLVAAASGSEWLGWAAFIFGLNAVWPAVAYAIDRRQVRW